MYHFTRCILAELAFPKPVHCAVDQWKHACNEDQSSQLFPRGSAKLRITRWRCKPRSCSRTASAQSNNIRFHGPLVHTATATVLRMPLGPQMQAHHVIDEKNTPVRTIAGRWPRKASKNASQRKLWLCTAVAPSTMLCRVAQRSIDATSDILEMRRHGAAIRPRPCPACWTALPLPHARARAYAAYAASEVERSGFADSPNGPDQPQVPEALGLWDRGLPIPNRVVPNDSTEGLQCKLRVSSDDTPRRRQSARNISKA